MYKTLVSFAVSFFLIFLSVGFSGEEKSTLPEREKGVVSRNRIATLTIHVESVPAGASVQMSSLQKSSDSLKESSIHVTPCDIEVGYLEETIYNDGSKGGRMSLDQTFSWSKGGFYFGGVKGNLEWKDAQLPKDFVLEPTFCVPLYIGLEGFHPVDREVCFKGFKDGAKEVRVVLERQKLTE